MSQIALPLTPRNKDDPARIVLGTANLHVAEALRDPERWPFRTAVLAGPPRSGKSLLARWFEGAGKGEAIDPADTLDETELFHRWNRAQEDGRPLLLVSGAQVWEIALPDLRSRIGAALHLEIGAPDDEMIAALIESHAARRGLALGEGALTYLVPRAERSFAGVERLVAAIDRLSLERKAAATLSVWRDALAAVQGPEQGKLGLDPAK
ncbi:P-loop NTPase family protein [Pelagerythrobacter rhizovicinus]|uniref:ATPase n=1 Tax=Pelagerythrobacter rhizovicinus TaxID=2268576 RepID=A0A4Q2KK63_9SPHN|nr:DnaA/Hda family protein [Pelagerythrobacter rhizovicinus]RXZ65655.1 ATPase [Pelagerythrobacter rhizovicinus]